MPDKALDPVEWKLVRADIAMEKARLKANGDWSKWKNSRGRRTPDSPLLRPLIGGRGNASHYRGQSEPPSHRA